MCSGHGGPPSPSSIEIGSIVVISGSSAPVSNIYLEWMNSAVSARSFNEKFSAMGREYGISKCRLAVARQEYGKVSMLMLVDILDSGPNEHKKERSFAHALDPVSRWVESTLETLIENASFGDHDVESPALLEITFCSGGSELESGLR